MSPISVNRQVKRILLLFSYASLLIGCSFLQNLSGGNRVSELKIGLIAPITGDLSSVGQSTLNAANLAIQEINNAGGLIIKDQTYRVVLVIEDNQDDAAEAVRMAQKLISEDKVAALIGPQASRNAIPVAKVAEAAQIPMITPWSSNPETTREKRYVFRVIASDAFQGKVIAQFSTETLAIQRAAVLYDGDSAYNSGLAEIFKQAFEESGRQVVAFETYETGTQDFMPQLTQIQASEAELIFLPNYSHEVPNQVRQAQALGITALFIGADAWFGITPEDREPLDGMFFTASWSPNTENETAQIFVKTYQQTYNQLPDDVAALTYDAFGLLFQAILNQKSVERDQIQKGLATLETYSGVAGAVEYLGNGDPLRSLVIMQIQQGEHVFYQLVSP